jgi:hypothetical protein
MPPNQPLREAPDGEAVCSVLAKARRADVVAEPFPHLVIRDALPAPFYDRLAAEYPSPALLADGRDYRNLKQGWNADKVAASAEVSPLWKAFVAYHHSQAFYREVVELFGDAIRARYPQIEKRRGKPIAELQVRQRHIKDRRAVHAADDFVTDCQILFDDTSDPRICRGPHVDAAVELYAGLLYFRHPDDRSGGGSLCICRAREPRAVVPAPDLFRAKHSPAEIDDADVEIVREIPYEANTLLMFLNSPASLHKVTPRSASPIVRRHVNIIGEIYSLPEGGLFRIEKPETGASASSPSLYGRVLGKIARLLR